MNNKKSNGISSVFGETRTTLPDIGPFKIPSNTIYCATCRYRLKGEYGYRNGNCIKYPKEKGKPNDILFKGAKCAYYRKDRSDV